MSQSPIIAAIKMLCEEKRLPLELVVETVESALAAAFRKDFGQLNQNVKVTLDMETGNFDVFDIKTVAEDRDLEKEAEEFIKLSEEKTKLLAEGKIIPPDMEERKRFNPKNEIMISEARMNNASLNIGDTVKTHLTVPDAFGRMAAQTAKQVVIQKLREAERQTVFTEFKSREGELILGTVQRKEGRVYLVDLGTAIAILPPEGQLAGENYVTGGRLKFYLEAVVMGPKGAEIRLSRTHENLVKALFAFEIPEIASGGIEVMSVARDPGSRSKVAVRAIGENIDPIGSCVGQKGTRVQTIISELGGEKIDIIQYSDKPEEFISHALSPAKVREIKVDPNSKSAVVTVGEDQLSLAIGKSGQNVRLAARLVGWKINILGERTGVPATVPSPASIKEEEPMQKEPESAPKSRAKKGKSKKE
ncbi:MAG: N utilization substance protein A [Parcubacteria group bacterium Gr01-1014_18]|nr:MAG: N utilization substance protein A [Parcubacteria group bacterium Greene0416_36]TSC80214.1 MAG: N utilization substance protein A [Parcubacteria group bacterium Gr01-1014_18]TSC98396.1 MAG: N utilization substance protein A [Parcubacteria group bacterium Greene1014_20]TSD06937.1 MAG: N utilization substance protein A [Parcubacteria group bacterium Greene0714_2]